MGSTSPQIKSLISLAYDYHLRRSEKNLLPLQRQLQILSVVNDLSIFEPTCMETLEFFVCLEQLLNESDPRSPLAWKVINLLTHISHSSTIRIAMRDEMQLLPVISQFLLTSKLSKDKTLKILQLLQELSYGIKIRRREAWLIKIIPYLVSVILDSETLDDGIEPAVITLANLCRGNPPAVTLIREYSERKLLLRTLTNLKSPSIRVQLLVSEIMLYINLDHSKLGIEQIMHMLDLLFMVATDGFADQDENLLQLSRDAFEEIVNRTDLQEAIKSYRKFGTTIQNIIGYVTEESNSECVSVIFHLMSLIIRVEHEDLSELINPLFSKVLPWLPDKRCGAGTQKLFHALILVADDTIIASHTQDFILALKESLSLKEELSPTLRSVEWVCSCLALVEALCARSLSLQLGLCKALAPPALTLLLAPLLALSEGGDDMRSLSQLSRCASPPLSSGAAAALLSSSSFSSSNQRTRTSLERQAKTTLVESCAEAVVRVLSVAKLLSVHDPEFKVEFRQMLGNPKVMKHIVCCERSSDVSLIRRATGILCDDSVPGENLSSLVQAQTEANLQSHVLPGVADLTPSESALLSSHALASSFSFCGASEQTVDRLISKLNGTVEKAELKDIPLTEVMELYEYKLAALAHNEINLQEALASSDAQNRKMSLGILQSKAESCRLRSLLGIWEERIQQAQKEKAEMEARVDEVKDSARRLRNDLVKDKTRLEREIAKLKGEVSSARREVEGKEEETRRLQRALSEANVEHKSLQKLIKQEQEEKHKLNEVLSKMEEERKKAKREFEELEKENSRIEKLQATLKKKNMELEMLTRSHEETLAEKETQLDELTKENNALKRIKDMIHNISSAKP